MKEFVDLQVVLATEEDMNVFDEDSAQEAAEQLNMILHMLYDRVNDDIPSESLEHMLQKVWDTWREDPNLLTIDPLDLRDWVDQLLATWDDAHI